MNLFNIEMKIMVEVIGIKDGEVYVYME